MIDVMEAPEGVRREAVPNSVCVQFYGPSASKGRDRDYCWATAEQLAPFGLNLALLEQQNIPKRMRPTAYREALVEARALYEEQGNNVSAVVAFDPEEAAADAAAADDLEDVDAPRCRLELDPRRMWSSLAAPFDRSSSLRRSHSSLFSPSSASARFNALLRLMHSRSNAP